MATIQAAALFPNPTVRAAAHETIYRVYALRFVPDAGDPPSKILIAKAVCKATGIQPSEFGLMSTSDKAALLKSLLKEAKDASPRLEAPGGKNAVAKVAPMKRDDTPSEAEISKARAIVKAAPKIPRDLLASTLKVGKPKATKILDAMRLEGLYLIKKRRPPRKR